MKQLTKWHMGIVTQEGGIRFALFRTTSMHYWGVRYTIENGERKREWRVKHFLASYHGEREHYNLAVPTSEVVPWLEGYLARMGDDREKMIIRKLVKDVTDALQDEVNNEQDV